MIVNAIEYKPLPLYGDGLNIRDWLYVRDHCSAIWTIMKHGKRGDTYNIGGNSEMENIRIVELICDILDDLITKKHKKSRIELITHVKDRPGHDRRYAIDATKIMTELGWQPSVTFEEGIRKTIDWYLNNKAWLDGVVSGDYQKYYEAMYSNR